MRFCLAIHIPVLQRSTWELYALTKDDHSSTHSCFLLCVFWHICDRIKHIKSWIFIYAAWVIYCHIDKHHNTQKTNRPVLEQTGLQTSTILHNKKGHFNFWSVCVCVCVIVCMPVIPLSFSLLFRQTHTHADPVAHWAPVSHAVWRLAVCN